MMAEMIQVKVTRRYTASAERVFDAFLDPAKARKFMFATPQGQMVRAELDPRVGGRFNFTDRRDGQDVEHVGKYLQIERPKRLVFSMRVDKETEETTVTIEIKPVAGGCELTLTHEMSSEWANYQAKVESGWTMILDGLEKALA